jgi:hypothetical protein
MARGEIYVQLFVNYADDPKVRALARFGRDARPARDLYIQMLCYCKSNLIDGNVPHDQLGILVHPDPVKVGERHAQMLVDVGLCRPVKDGWNICGYLKRNKSRAQVEQEAEEKARKGREANHKRWHQEKVDQSCEFCKPSVDRSGDRSSGESSGDRPPNPHRSEVIGHRSEDRGQAPTEPASVTQLRPGATMPGQRLLEEHLEALDRPLTRDTIKDLGRQVELLLADGFTERDVREGLGVLRRSNGRLGPAMLPRLVDQAIGERPQRRTESERMFS